MFQKGKYPRGTRVPASYQLCDSTVTLYGKEYRAIVVHSDAHDKRRLKRLERRLGESLKDAGDRLKKVCDVEYFCREDAEAAAKRLSAKPTRYHSYQLGVKKQATYTRGRPPINGQRKVSSVKYIVIGPWYSVSDRIKALRTYGLPKNSGL